MNVEKIIAGVSAGAGAITLIVTGNVTEGAIILSAMVGFFVGDQNGNKRALDTVAKLVNEHKLDEATAK